MSAARNYDDPCGTARALDIIGERWALLTVRELLLGPKRFGQLRRDLTGVSPNVLSQRLRDLEAAGVVQRSTLAPPASVAVYELTSRGYALEPILIELGRWGSQQPQTSTNELTIDALLLAFKTTFAARSAPSSLSATFAVQVDGEWFAIVVADGAIDVSRGRPAHADTTFETDRPTLRQFGFGRESLSSAESSGRLVVSGNRSMARRFPKLFAIPVSR